eukprot:12414932-Karenia_brevis.AAC.1
MTTAITVLQQLHGNDTGVDCAFDQFSDRMWSFLAGCHDRNAGGVSLYLSKDFFEDAGLPLLCGDSEKADGL